jgi:ABC-type Mn2+/Zn2+ transport system permease subunit
LSALVAPAVLLLLSTLVLAAWIEGRRWALAIDALRQVALVVMAAAYLVAAFGPVSGGAIAGGFAAILAIIFAVLRPDAERTTAPLASKTGVA